MPAEETIRVRFTRHGGFSGVPLRVEVDSQSLMPDQTATLRRLLEAADFFNLPVKTESRRGADRFQYRVSVELGSRRREVEVSDQSMPDSLAPVIEFLTDVARASRAR